MKRKMRFICMCLALAVVCSSVFVGCGPSGEDDSKSILYVWNYDGGVGHKWLDAVIERFEEEKATSVYQEGKTGVKIKKFDTKDSPINTLGNSAYSVFFLEGVSYNALEAQGKFLKITDMVKSTENSEGVSIESKLTADRQSALKGYDGDYYVLPHYQSFNGVTYNKTLFDLNGWYFAKDESDYRIKDPTQPLYGFVEEGIDYDYYTQNHLLTCGPDGVYGTEDDGLPSSVEEFERLCVAIKNSGGAYPFIWYDGSNKAYQTNFVNALWCSLEGYDGVMSNFTFNSNGKETEIVTGFNGDEPVTQKEVITKDNVWDVYQQASRYYTLKMAQKVFKEEGYSHPDSKSGTYSHTDIQETFFESMYSTRPIAMIFEGSYWMNELKDSGGYDRVIGTHPEAEDMELKMMPLPVQAKGSVEEGKGRTPTPIDILSSYAFINANVKIKYGEAIEKLAKDFLAYCYTDVSLREFNVKTGVTKDLIYDMGDSVNELSVFGKSVYNAKKTGSVVEPFSADQVFINHASEFSMYSTSVLWKSGLYTYVSSGMQAGVSAKEYFNGLKKTQSWWDDLNN